VEDHNAWDVAADPETTVTPPLPVTRSSWTSVKAIGPPASAIFVRQSKAPIATTERVDALMIVSTECLRSSCNANYNIYVSRLRNGELVVTPTDEWVNDPHKGVACQDAILQQRILTIRYPGHPLLSAVLI
jgi:hypothetical protein